MTLSDRDILERRSLSKFGSYLTGRGFDRFTAADDFLGATGIKGQSLEDGRLSNREDLLKFTDLLARFHCCAEGFYQPEGSRMNVKWGKLGDKYRKMTLMLRNYYRELWEREQEQEQEDIDLQQRMIREKCSEILTAAEKTIVQLNSEYYLCALSSSMSRRELCLNRIGRDFVCRREDEFILVLSKYIGYNMAIEDLVKLIKKIPIREDKQILQREMISVYYDVREIDEASMLILKELISYPYEAVKNMIRYSKGCLSARELIHVINRENGMPTSTFIDFTN